MTTKRSQEIPLVAWRQNFLENHLARVPITHNQEGNLEMMDEVLSSVGARDIGTSGYQVSDPNDVELYWEKDQLRVDAVFRPGIGIPFSRSTFKDFETDSSAGNPILIDKEEVRRTLLQQL